MQYFQLNVWELVEGFSASLLFMHFKWIFKINTENNKFFSIFLETFKNVPNSIVFSLMLQIAWLTYLLFTLGNCHPLSHFHIPSLPLFSWRHFMNDLLQYEEKELVTKDTTEICSYGFCQQLTLFWLAAKEYRSQSHSSA